MEGRKEREERKVRERETKGAGNKAAHMKDGNEFGGLSWRVACLHMHFYCRRRRSLALSHNRMPT